MVSLGMSCGIIFRRIEEVDKDDIPSVQANPKMSSNSSIAEFLKFRRLCVSPAPLPSQLSEGLKNLFSGYRREGEYEIGATVGSAVPNDTGDFNSMLNELQQQTVIENMEMQKAQAFWNPIESMSKWDATS